MPEQSLSASYDGAPQWLGDASEPEPTRPWVGEALRLLVAAPQRPSPSGESSTAARLDQPHLTGDQHCALLQRATQVEPPQGGQGSRASWRSPVPWAAIYVA